MSQFDYARMTKGVDDMTVKFEDIPGMYIDAWIKYKNRAKRFGYELKLLSVELNLYYPHDMLVFFYDSEKDNKTMLSVVFIDRWNAYHHYNGTGIGNWSYSLED